jgi:hypothetical protein
MQNTFPFSNQFSEQWLLEGTYHAHLLNGGELSVANLTQAMRHLTEISAPFSSQLSHLFESMSLQSLQKSITFFVPISTWQESTWQEAAKAYQHDQPVLLYSEHAWHHGQDTSPVWSLGRNMRSFIYGKTVFPPESISGTEYAVCYLDAKRGAFSNSAWKTWFPSDTTSLFNDSSQSIQSITFLVPSQQFPFTTHYTLITPDGHVSEYQTPAAALQGFTISPSQDNLHASREVAPTFCFYHDVQCSNGTYRLVFFPDLQGYVLPGYH